MEKGPSMAVTVRRFLVVSLCVLSSARTWAQQYTVTDLGTLGGDDQQMTAAAAINGSGQVVGSSPVQGSTGRHAFLWSEGNMQDLGLLPGSTECFATAINDRGQVVGYCGGGVSIDKVFRWAADTGMTTIETPDWAVADGMNNQGDIVGSLNATPGSTTDIHAFRYRNGAVEDLGPGRASGTNDLGQVVGSNTDGTRALLWDEDGAHDLGSLEGPDGRSGAFAINADGIPAGNSTTGGPFGERHAVLWTPSGMSNLGSLGGVYASANAISGDLIVGTSQTSDPSQGGHAFLYDNQGPGYPVDLNDLIPSDAGWILRGASGVNAAGQIVGLGFVGHAQHAFLLTPVPPTTTPR
jgi:probable HAF family extracellular repeat protein